MDDWNSKSQFQHPKLLAYQKTLEGTKSDRKAQRKLFTHPAKQLKVSEEFNIQPGQTPSYKFYLVESEKIKSFVTNFGLLKTSCGLRNNFFSCHTTNPTISKNTKITLVSVTKQDIDRAAEILIQFFRKKEINFKELPQSHCSLCYEPGHLKAQCHNCSYCSSKNHYRRDCLDLMNSQDRSCSINVIISKRRTSTKSNYLNKRRQKRMKIGGQIWFRRNDTSYNTELEQYMKPLEMEGNNKITVSFDVEGAGNGENSVGSIHVSGWFGGSVGIKTVYYVEVKNEKTTNPNTTITGLQITEHQNGASFDTVRANLIRIFSNKRVITQGLTDWDRIKISKLDRANYNIEDVNLQELYSGGMNPMGLTSLDKFLYKHNQKLKRDDTTHVTAGHSPERDSRLTLLGFRSYTKLIQLGLPVPNGDQIRSMADQGDTIEDWINQRIKCPITNFSYIYTNY